MELEQQAQPLANEQRTQWNGFLDNLNGQPVTEETINAHAQANPGFSITPEMIPQIQQEHADIRTGNSFGNINADQLNKVRAGMSPSFTNETDLSKSYYPQFKIGGQDFGTDIEGYSKSKLGIAPTVEKAPSPAESVSEISNAVKSIPINTSTVTENNPIHDATPLPDFGNSKSRLQYVGTLLKKYGPVMQGRGDTPLNVNEIPRGGHDTAKNISTKAASKYGIDPALLYSSAMEEGMSGLFKSKATGVDTKGRKPGDFGYQDFYSDKEYPVAGKDSLGLNTFADRFPYLVKAGYLPKEFSRNFRNNDNEAGQGNFKNNFKNVESALQAKAALLKYSEDDVQRYADQKGIKLPPEAKEFFTLVSYNGGEGTAHSMLKDYNENGLVQSGSYLSKRPTSGKGLKDTSYKDVYDHVIARIKMRNALKKEGLF